MFKFEDKDMLPYASLEDIYKYCNHYDLFRYYVGDFKMGKPILSPLASENNPSFAIFTKGTKILFNDFRLGGGDIITFLMKRDNITFRQAINKIVHDSGLNDKFKSDNDYIPKPFIKYNKVINYIKPDIKVKRRKWLKYDLEFWNKFGITKSTLTKYRVNPIQYIFFGQKIVVAEKYAYVFIESKDNIDTLTIYQPFSKDNKWFKSHDASVFYGWSQLPNKSDSLLITKSMKDVMTIDAISGIPVVALQNEKLKPKKHIITELKKRFKKIYLLYDNDYGNINNDKPNYGREFGKTIANTYELIQLEIPDHLAIEYNAKDISDLVKHSSITLGRSIINNLDNYIIQ